jgi:hypothetical protein
MTALLSASVLLVGALLDVAANLTLFSIACLDAPRELLVTARLKRYAAWPDGWRRRFALWFADDLLDDFDLSGKHV